MSKSNRAQRAPSAQALRSILEQHMPQILGAVETVIKRDSDYGAILFGSYGVRGTPCASSDVDIAVFVDKGPHPERQELKVGSFLIDLSYTTWPTVEHHLRHNKHSRLLFILSNSKLIVDSEGRTAALIDLAKSLTAAGPMLTPYEVESIQQTLNSYRESLPRTLQDGRSVANFAIITTLFLLADFEAKISGYFGAMKTTQVLEDIEHQAPKVAPLFRLSADPRVPLKIRMFTICRLMDDQERRLQELSVSGRRISLEVKESKPEFWAAGHGLVASNLPREWSSPLGAS